MSKPELLMLVHRIPFPPDKGDKIRSFRILEHLSRHYQIHLGTFVDDQRDWQFVDKVREYCVSSEFTALKPMLAKLKSVSGLLTGEPLSLTYYASSKMKKWASKAVLENNIERVLVFSSTMAQFVPSNPRIRNKVIDFVDVDSDKWRQYSEEKSGLASYIFKREASKLEEYEKKLAGEFDRSYFVAPEEAELFRDLLDNRDHAKKVDDFRNGVDQHFFDPAREYPNPFNDDQNAIVFIGAMDYWANVNAATWFVKNVWPLLIKQRSDLKFYIVGSNPTDEVTALAGPNISVTGRVDDVRDYLANSSIAVAPLQIARGIQNKVLESLAMNRPIVSTSCAMSGLVITSELESLTADSPADFAQACLHWLDRAESVDVQNYIETHYNWATNLQVLERTLKQTSGQNA